MRHTHAHAHNHTRTYTLQALCYNKHSDVYTLTYQKHKLKNIINEKTAECISNITGKSYEKGQYMLSKCNLYEFLKDALVLQQRIYLCIAFHILAA